MEKLVNIQYIEGPGLKSLLGEYVQFWCMNYIYAGKLVGVNKHNVILEEAVVVYETGKLGGKFQTAESVGTKELFICTSAIESYCLTRSTKG